MTEISAALVNELRNETNLGMMECKKALLEAKGDKQAAIRLLRERGMAVAQKKASRTTNSGLIASLVKSDGSAASLVEVNCETDFVAKNEGFLKFVQTLATKALEGDANLAETEKAGLNSLIQAIGENMVIRRNARFVCNGPGQVASYIHMGGKIGVLAEIGCTKAETVKNAAFVEAAKDVCMQIAASVPQYLEPSAVPADVIAAEREIYAKQVQGKPANIVGKIVDGKIQKFYADVCLLLQPFIKEPKQNVTAVLAAASKAAGDTITVRRFARYQLA